MTHPADENTADENTAEEISADEMSADTVVTIRHRHNHQERLVAAAALPFFVRPGGPWQRVAEPAPPARSASKAAWVAYAIRRGMDGDVATAHTRAELAAYFSPTPGESSTPTSSTPTSTAAAGGTES